MNELDIYYLQVLTYSERASIGAAGMEEIIPMKKQNEPSKILWIRFEQKVEKILHQKSRIDLQRSF